MLWFLIYSSNRAPTNQRIFFIDYRNLSGLFYALGLWLDGIYWLPFPNLKINQWPQSEWLNESRPRQLLLLHQIISEASNGFSWYVFYVVYTVYAVFVFLQKAALHLFIRSLFWSGVHTVNASCWMTGVSSAPNWTCNSHGAITNAMKLKWSVTILVLPMIGVVAVWIRYHCSTFITSLLWRLWLQLMLPVSDGNTHVLEILAIVLALGGIGDAST